MLGAVIFPLLTMADREIIDLVSSDDEDDASSVDIFEFDDLSSDSSLSSSLSLDSVYVPEHPGAVLHPGADLAIPLEVEVEIVEGSFLQSPGQDAKEQ